MKFKSDYSDWNVLFVAQQGARRKPVCGKSKILDQLTAGSLTADGL
jgi:hypothetical protein